ncbi:MAG: hypothetical protein ACWA5L_01705 [bacterium]
MKAVQYDPEFCKYW